MYKIISILSDSSSIELKKIPDELFLEIEMYLKKSSSYADFQLIYDNLCLDEESQDVVLNSFWDKIKSCETINCEVIVEY
jgi:hypothetical protein